MHAFYKPHPYGVYPRGNIANRADYDQRLGTLSKLVTAITRGDEDGSNELPFLEIMQNIFSFLEVPDLCRLSRASSGFYVLIHCTDAFKEAYTVLSPKRLYYVHSWKDTAVNGYLQGVGKPFRWATKEEELQSHIGSTANKKKKVEKPASGKATKGRKGDEEGEQAVLVVPPHIPIAMHRPFFSDNLFQSWMCCILPTDYHLHKVPTSEELPPSTKEGQAHAEKKKAPARGKRAHADAAFPPAAEEGHAAQPKQQYTSAFKPVERRDGSKLSFDDFRKEFEKPNIPVVLTNVATEWPFYKILNQNFCNLSAKKEQLVKSKAVIDDPLRCEYTNMNLDEYVQYAMTQKDERPIYMFDAEFGNVLDINRLYTVPDFFARDDFFSVMGAERPKYRWIIAGPHRGGSSFHVDPNYTNAWNANLTGRKRWLLFPPGATPPGVVPSENMAEVATPVSLSEWLLNNYDDTVQQFRRQGYECVCEAGDIMFVPSGWWHSVINLEDSVAITQNYVSESNLSNVVKFLRYMKGSISGINEDADDATEEGTKKRQVGFANQFITAMEKKFPSLMASVEEQLLEEHRQREKRRPVALPLLEKDSEGFHFDF